MDQQCSAIVKYWTMSGHNSCHRPKITTDQSLDWQSIKRCLSSSASRIW